MTAIKDYIGKMFVGNAYHFKCNCLLQLDFEGKVKDYEIVNGEVILLVEKDKKIVRLGINHPNLTIENL